MLDDKHIKRQTIGATSKRDAACPLWCLMVAVLLVCSCTSEGRGTLSRTDVEAPLVRQQELAAILTDELRVLGKDASSTDQPLVSGPDSVIFDLTADELPNPAGAPLSVQGATLHWTEQLPGDFDQNGLVDFSDVSALAQHFGEKVQYLRPPVAGGRSDHPVGDPEGDGALNWRLARIDGDHNGTINAGDLTAIARHFHESIDNYWLCWRRGGQQNWEPCHVVTPMERSTAKGQPVRCRLMLMYPQDMGGFKPGELVEFLVRPSGKNAGELGEPSTPIALTLNSQQWETGPRAGLAEAIAADDDGNLYAVGSVIDSSAFGYRHLLLSKTRQPGLPQWQKHYGGSDYCRGNAVAIDSTCAVVICGVMQNDGAPNSNTLLIKTTRDGELLFQRRLQFSVNCNTSFTAVGIADDNSIYAAGTFGGYDYQTQEVYDALLLVHFDAAGNLLWSKCYRADPYIGTPDLVVNASHLYVVAFGGAICLDLDGAQVWSEGFQNSGAGHLAAGAGGQLWISGGTVDSVPNHTTLWFAALGTTDGAMLQQSSVQINSESCVGSGIQWMTNGDIWSGGMVGDGYANYPYLVHLDQQAQFICSFKRGLGSRETQTMPIAAVQDELVVSAPYREPGLLSDGNQPVWDWMPCDHSTAAVAAVPLVLREVNITAVEKDPAFELQEIPAGLAELPGSVSRSTIARVH